MFFRQVVCFILLLMLAIGIKKIKKDLTLRDLKYCMFIGFTGISLSQYFQLQNYKTLLYQSGVYRLAIWQVCMILLSYFFQTIVPVLVTFFSMVLKLEKHSKTRYVAIGIDFVMMIVVFIVRGFFCKDLSVLKQSIVNDYGENESHDKRYLLYILIVIVSNAVQFILTKLLL